MGEHGEIYLTMYINGEKIKIDNIDIGLKGIKERNCLKEFLKKIFWKKDRK